MTTFVEAAAHLLDTDEREAVLGDLAEAGAGAFRSILDIFGLLLRRQAMLWKNCRPWLAGFGLALPSSFLLMGVSVGVSLDHGLTRILLLIAWSWTAGFVVGSLSSRTLWVSATLCLLPCLFCLSRFRVESLSRLSLLLFLVPAILGVRYGVRNLKITLASTLPLAMAVTALMIPAWNRTSWMNNLALLWPAWYIVATARKTSRSAPYLTIALAAMIASPATAQSRLETRELQSKNFANSKIGVSPIRKLVIYLPPGYDGSQKRYPAIYLLPNPIEGPFRFVFDQRNAQGLFDQAIAAHAIDKFILVCPDMATPLGSSWYVNSPATGNWEDFMIQELVPYIDKNFKTLPNRDSRGIAGIFMGGYGAIRFGMTHPDIFGAVYGMHPVGTGSGLKIMDSLPNWDLLANAKSLDEVKKDGYSVIFTTIFQAHLPNPDKPPLYIDLAARKEGDRLVIDSKLTERLRNSFFLESMIPRYADNLKSLRALKFDWARSDPNQDHVYSNQALTHKLNEFGIAHEAEEYNGAWGESNWGEDGRIYSEVLPFFGRHLVFEEDKQRSRR